MPKAFTRLVPVISFLIGVPFAFSLPIIQRALLAPPEAVERLLERSRDNLRVEPVVHRDVVYDSNLLRDHRIDVYEPIGDYTDGDAPAVVFLHGGSWIHGTKETIHVIDRFLRRMRQSGYFVLVPNYTTNVLRGLGGAADMAETAIRWIAEHANEYGFDRNRIGLYGVSAGGHVGLLAASRMDPDKYPFAFVFAECAPTDLIAMREGDAFDRSYVFRFFPEFRLRELSPVEYVSQELPPILLMHGGSDEVVHIDQSVLYADAVAAAGGQVEFYRYPKGNHAFLNLSHETWYEQETIALDFFRRSFAKAQS